LTTTTRPARRTTTDPGRRFNDLSELRTFIIASSWLDSAPTTAAYRAGFPPARRPGPAIEVWKYLFVQTSAVPRSDLFLRS
jgi:hypothetical protein